MNCLFYEYYEFDLIELSINLHFSDLMIAIVSCESIEYKICLVNIHDLFTLSRNVSMFKFVITNK